MGGLRRGSAARMAVEHCPVRWSTVGVGELIACGPGARGRTHDDQDLRVERLSGDHAEVRCNFVVPDQRGIGLHRETTFSLIRRRSGCAPRWLVECPSCSRACQELVIVDGAAAWSCRVCSELTYRSQQSRVAPLDKILAREHEARQQLRRSRSADRVRLLHARVCRLGASRRRVMAKPVTDLLGLLQSVVDRG